MSENITFKLNTNIMEHLVKIKSIEYITHDVLKVVTEKPENYNYKPGQAVDVTINKEGWKEKKNPFTFTSIPEDDFLEFVIKVYPEHNGTTNELSKAKAGDELIIYDVFGSISYKGEGVFIAGGSGITPFLSIFKALQKENAIGNNKLIFANKTKADIIDEANLKAIFGDNLVSVLSAEDIPGYEKGYITAELIKEHAGDLTNFYLCAPRPMMKAMTEHFETLGISDSQVIKERF